MRPFAYYYDAIYCDKDYRKDNQILRDLVPISHRPKILEIGSGTGNQTVCLARWADVVAVETDADFASVMRSKGIPPHVTLFEGDIAGLSDKDFDAAAAFFNVINYIYGRDVLLHFFKAIAARIKQGAILTFDMWQAEAVIQDPPQITTRIKPYNNRLGVGSVTQIIAPHLNVTARDIALVYNITVEPMDGHVPPAAFSETLHMFLWLKNEVIDVLHEAGFSDVQFADGRNYPSALTPQSWINWVTARKIREIT
jgi:SAM-dependent methyltransferase